jgi:membrane protease YdiL (CAAX protease family)
VQDAPCSGVYFAETRRDDDGVTVTSTRRYRPLDAEVAQDVAADARPWRLEIVASVLAVPILAVALGSAHQVGGLPIGPANILVELLLLGLVLALLKPLAAQKGGPRLIGLDPPRAGDVWIALRWLLVQIGVRFAVVIALVATIPSLRQPGHKVSNIEGIKHLNGANLVLVIIAATVLAPITEEIAFRGIVLRGLMRRWSFWPSAITSSVAFGALHGYEVSGAVSRFVLIAVTGTFGLFQCILARRTARLVPGMIVHGLANAASIAFALA